MISRLTFIKIANLWYVHLPNYDGPIEDLEMVYGADALCHELDTDMDGVVNVLASENNEFITDDPDWDFLLDFIMSTTDENGNVNGAYYNAYDDKNFTQTRQIWLCNITKIIFKKFPASIYIKTIK